MMTFPGLSEDRIQTFDQHREETTIAFLNQQPPPRWIKDKGELTVLNQLYEGLNRKDNIADLHRQHETLLEVARVALWLEREKGKGALSEIEEKNQVAGARFLKYREKMTVIDRLQQQSALKGTIAGWMGTKLEVITRPLGFEYRTNIALVGGFAAKEVIISTLGTAYSLSDVDEEKTDSLSEKLKKDPAWNPLQAFTLIIFIMLYVPCVATVVSIRKESSWKWAAFSIFFNLLVAYGVSLIIRQGGVFLGLGG
jgi:ferrous iron transport protein B